MKFEVKIKYVNIHFLLHLELGKYACHRFLQYFILNQPWIVVLNYEQNDDIHSRDRMSMFVTPLQNYFYSTNWNYFLSFQTTKQAKLLRRNVYSSHCPSYNLFASWFKNNPSPHTSLILGYHPWQSYHASLSLFWIPSVTFMVLDGPTEKLGVKYSQIFLNPEIE